MGWAIRCYKLYSKISNVEKQDGFIRDLTSTTGVFARSYWEQMGAETVQMPPDVRQTGNFSLKHLNFSCHQYISYIGCTSESDFYSV